MLLPAYLIGAFLTAPPAQIAPKTDPAVVEYQLSWVKQVLPTAPGEKPGEPVIMGRPRASTTDRQVTSFSLGDVRTGDSFAVSLSPTVEPADNLIVAPGGEAVKKTGATVLTLWTLKVVDKTFPGGVSRIELAGSTRFALGDDKDAVLTSFSLSDPKTGIATQYRLVGRAKISEIPKTP